MVPKIAKTGTSFKGAFAYYCHDKNAKTSDRVDFSQSVNMRTDTAEQVWRIMAATAQNQDGLKRQFGGKAQGRKAGNTVYAFSLSWSPDETPTREQMTQAAHEALKTLGAEDHQAYLIAHNDEQHAHIHVIVNRVHPEKGTVLDLWRDQDKLSEWSLDYEKKQGKVRCTKRAENKRKREAGEFVKYRPPVIQNAWRSSENGKQFQTALDKGGYILARGDKRGFVVLDPQGKVLNPTRKIERADGKNIRVKELNARLSDLDRSKLPSVAEARVLQKQREEQRGKEEQARKSRSKAKQPYQPKYRMTAAERRAAKAWKYARAKKAAALKLKQLDEKRAFEFKADQRRENALTEGRKFVDPVTAKKQLKTAQAELKAKSGLFNRITGRTQKAADKVTAFRQNLEDAQTREKEWMSRIDATIKRDETAMLMRHKRELEEFKGEAAQENKTRKERRNDPLSQAWRDLERNGEKQKSKDKGKGRGRDFDR